GTRVILASALYVKSKWVKPFEKMEKSLPFNSMSGKISARGMTVVNNYRVADDDRYRAVSIPAYGQVSLEVYLPRDKETPIDVVRRLEETQVSFLDETRGVKVVMPYWHIESEHSLVGPLSQLGVKTPFGPLAAFPALGGGIYISEIRQKAYIDVNEKGFEAAAATVVGHSGLGAEPTFKDPQLFIVDRPFYFVVRDEKTRLALFSGFVYEPERIWRFARA
ncbi:MAG TPA: serpin family protein, partial [Fimbriimonadaceae bacterium]|nr:serpin family protein [Fimbriimonadaceae bacterium]